MAKVPAINSGKTIVVKKVEQNSAHDPAAQLDLTAKKHFQAGRYLEARNIYQRIRQDFPNRKEFLYDYARAQHEYARDLVEKNNYHPDRIREYKKAEELFLLAHNEKKNTAASYNNLGAVYIYLDLAHKEEKISQPKEYLKLAAENIQKALSLDKNNCDAFFNKSLIDHAQGKYPSADQNFSKAINLKLDKKYAAIGYFFAGEREFKQKNYAKAVLELNKAVNLGLKIFYLEKARAYLAQAYYQFACKSFINDQYSTAYQNAKKALSYGQKYLNEMQINTLLGASIISDRLSSKNKQKLQEAIVYLSRAIELEKDFKANYYIRGIAYALLGNTKSAIYDLSAYGKKTPYVYFWYGYANFGKDNKKSLEGFMLAKQLFIDNYPRDKYLKDECFKVTLSNIAKVYRLLGNLEAAQKTYQELKKYFPGFQVPSRESLRHSQSMNELIEMDRRGDEKGMLKKFREMRAELGRLSKEQARQNKDKDNFLMKIIKKILRWAGVKI